MTISKNTNIFLYTLKEIIHFFPSDSGISYLSQSTNEEICIYEKNILKFDVDIDSNGNIGVVILDCEGKFFYYYYDGKTWTSHLLYEVDFNIEEFKHISIKFSRNSPYILFCWRDLSSPNLWSIISYYHENDYWKKEVLNRIYIKQPIKPYILIKDIDYNLYYISLKNNNLIYDLILRNLPSQSYKWSNLTFLSNCIFLKHFYLDALIDSEGIIHVSWIDKYKKEYCIKYISIDIKNHKASHLEQLLKMDVPLLHQQLLCQNKHIFCYGITKQHIYFTKKHTHSAWNDPHMINLSLNSIHLIKIIKTIDNPFIKYTANYILSESSSTIDPISITEIHSNKASFIQSNHSKKDTIHDSSLDTYKKLEIELYQKSQELEMKNNLLKALQGNISFLKRELDRLNTQNRNYINTLYSNNDKFKKYKSNTNNLEKNYEKILSEFDLSEQKNNELMNEITIYQNQLKKMKDHLDTLDKENTSLKNEIAELKNANLLKRLFH
ncbi:hypothetical protein [Crassaminicella profunda]|uniref:hypothetical protein n=1 Tax=Crassaminicella profunda TaxID=1286698 RepID=UPI001CA74B6F|nr:hypothetical protein [Crassaminicella profunda]QZY57025.1 hypothetical protein K7H06_08940 [Crassaminicella profunda]